MDFSNINYELLDNLMDDQVGRDMLKSQLGINDAELDLLAININPVKWSKVYLNWEARDYQELMLKSMRDKKLTTLRLGRRLGKSECMCISILWHAFTQPNKGPNNQYDILIICPFEEQVDLIFKRLKQLIDLSPELKASIKKDVHHKLTLHNGTVIKGLTAGSKSNTGAANTRGQRADLIVLDEVDYMNDGDITNIVNIRNEAPERIKIMAASTPSGDRSMYYKWCTEATHSFTFDLDESARTGNAIYNMKHNPSGNGWCHIHAPSTVNKELLKFNPDTNKTYIDELKETLTDMRFIQEVMAEFGESEAGVYQKQYIDKAIELGKLVGTKYYDKNFPRRGPRILGVDWDKKGASTNMVGVEYIPELGLFAPFCRVEIPRHQFTFDEGVKKIIELNEEFDFDYVMLDAGSGEYQYETLVKHGIHNPGSGLAHKIIQVNFSEVITTRDPLTKQKIKKDIKPFMVNNLVKTFEREKIALNPNDKPTIRQFEEYEVKRWGVNGRPIYTDENEHIHDCIMLAHHGFVLKYSDMLKVDTSAVIAGLRKLRDNMDVPEVKSRDNIEAEKRRIVPQNGVGVAIAAAAKSRNTYSRRAGGNGMRRMF